MRAKVPPTPTTVPKAIARRRSKPRVIPGDFELTSMSGLPVLRYGTGSVSLVYVHGGAYVSDIDPRHLELCRYLSTALAASVVLPLYPLAPEHTWCDSFDAMVDLVAGLASSGPTVMAGDSAGGGYALAVAMGLRDRGGPTVARLALISPWVDLTASASGIVAAADRDPWLRLDWLETYATMWAGSEADRSAWQVSPALGSLHDLPPTLALIGTHDLLHAENVVLQDRARAAGWDYTLIEEPGLIHVYPLLPIPEAKRARAQVAGFLRG